MAIDIIAIPVPLGAGNFAMHFCGDAIDNQTTFKFHVAGLIGRSFRYGCPEAMFGEVYDAPHLSCTAIPPRRWRRTCGMGRCDPDPSQSRHPPPGVKTGHPRGNAGAGLC